MERERERWGKSGKELWLDDNKCMSNRKMERDEINPKKRKKKNKNKHCQGISTKKNSRK